MTNGLTAPARLCENSASSSPATRKVPEMKILLLFGGLWFSAAFIFLFALGAAAARRIPSASAQRVLEGPDAAQSHRRKWSWRQRHRKRPLCAKPSAPILAHVSSQSSVIGHQLLEQATK